MQPRRRAGFPFGAHTSWRAAAAAAERLFGAYFPMRVVRRCRIPSGPLVVAANHFSHLDPVIVAIAVRRPIRYLAVDELFGNSRFFDGFTLWMGAIPMTRTKVPLSALRLALAELASGGVVGLYPEGVRVWRWGEMTPKRGAAWLARKAAAPLLPIAIAGSDEAMGRGTTRIGRRPLRVTVCEPIRPGDHAGADDPDGSMMGEWRRRVDRELRSWYGD